KELFKVCTTKKGGFYMAIKVAVAGEIRSGKDTVAEYIQSKIKYMKKLYFAKGIECVIYEFFPESIVDGKKPRKHYQDIGQYLRKVNPDVWVNYLERDYQFNKAMYNTENFI